MPGLCGSYNSVAAVSAGSPSDPGSLLSGDLIGLHALEVFLGE